MCRWIYCLFLAIDANFQLELKSHGIKDLELGTGLAYFVDTKKFQQHLQNCAHDEEVSLSPHWSGMTLMNNLDRSRPVGPSSMLSIKQIRGYRKIFLFLVLAQLSATMAWFERMVSSTSKKANSMLHIPPSRYCMLI